LTALDDVSLLAVQQQGEAMLRCLLWALVAVAQPTKGAADRRQFFPPATAGSPAAPQATAAP
jgi:hypothetical protein